MEKTIIIPGNAFVNKELTKATKQIDKLNENVRSNLYEIAHIIDDVKSRKLYADDEFKDVAEWAKECFGYEKSMTYNLAKIGHEYTVPVINEKGKTVGYRSNLIESGADYTTSQVIKMLPAGREIAKELNDNGVINPGMSVREIEKAIKNATSPESLEEETDVTDDVEKESENEKTEFVTIPVDLIRRIINVLEEHEEADLLLEIDKYFE